LTANKGALEVCDVRDNALVGGTAMGGVGSEWHFVGVGDFSGNPGETDMLMQDVNNGNLELYDIRNDTIASAQSAGGIGTSWQSVGIAAYQSAGAAVASSGDLSSVATSYGQAPLDGLADAASNLPGLPSPSASAGAPAPGAGTPGLPQIASFMAPTDAAPAARKARGPRPHISVSYSQARRPASTATRE
jgi:hypothetical protein